MSRGRVSSSKRPTDLTNCHYKNQLNNTYENRMGCTGKYKRDTTLAKWARTKSFLNQ